MDYRFSIKYWFLGWITLLAGICKRANGQQKERLDSLHAVVSSAATDTSRASALIELSKLYMGIDDDRAFQLARRAVQQTENAGSPLWSAYALNTLGTMYDVKARPDSASACFLNALRIFERIGDAGGMAAVHQNLGVMHYYQKDFAKALAHYGKALGYRRQTNEPNYVAQLYNNIGAIMRRRQEYDSAIAYYKLALDIKKKLNDKRSLASSYINLSVAYQHKKDFASATQYVYEAIALCRETGNDFDLASAQISLGQIYLHMRKPKEAFEQTRAALGLAQKLKASDLLYNIYQLLSLCDTLVGDHKAAFADYVNAMYYKEEVYSKEKAEAVSRLQTIYETEKKDHAILLLNAENETRVRQRNSLVAILLLFVILLGIATWAFLNKRRDNRVLRAQKAEIESKTERLKAQAAQIARLSSQMNPHFLFNALNSLQRFMLTSEQGKGLAHINQLSALMRATLNNSSKEHITLEEEKKYLEDYLSFEKNLLGEQLIFSIGTNGIDAGNTLLPPMLVQPLVENAVKHGLATKEGEKRVAINFAREGAHILKVTVSDNGIGRPATSASAHASKALGITQSRLRSEFEKQGAAVPENIFEIADVRGEGTEVTLRVPLIEEF